MKNLFILSVLIFAGSGMTRCKAKYSLNGSTIPVEAKTISVLFFTNQAPLAGPTLAQKFTEKLRDVVSSQTNLALKQNAGDLNFEGYISEYSVAPVAIQNGDAAALNRLTITVVVKYTNKFDKSKDFDQSFTRFSDFKATETLSSVENAKIEDINKQLTEDIFNKAFNNW
ncbi:MAG: LptE family protein [Bacteroidia bacterium]|nr:LptE family protein [Bacteroidia bacterium]